MKVRTAARVAHAGWIGHQFFRGSLFENSAPLLAVTAGTHHLQRQRHVRGTKHAPNTTRNGSQLFCRSPRLCSGRCARLSKTECAAFYVFFGLWEPCMKWRLRALARAPPAPWVGPAADALDRVRGACLDVWGKPIAPKFCV